MTADQFEALIKSGASGRQILSAYRQMVCRLSLEIANRDEEIANLKARVPATAEEIEKVERRKAKAKARTAKWRQGKSGVWIKGEETVTKRHKPSHSVTTVTGDVTGQDVTPGDGAAPSSNNTRSNLLPFPTPLRSSPPPREEVQEEGGKFPDREDIDLAIDAYQQVAEARNFPKCQTPLTDKRRAAFKCRLKELGSLDAWYAVMHKLNRPGSAFYWGENDRGWQCTFGFLLKPDSIVKLMERSDDQEKVHRNGRYKPGSPPRGH